MCLLCVIILLLMQQRKCHQQVVAGRHIPEDMPLWDSCTKVMMSSKCCWNCVAILNFCCAATWLSHISFIDETLHIQPAKCVS